jgi:hypothetical protein
MVNSYGNMSKVEKNMNKQDLSAYKNYKKGIKSMIPGHNKAVFESTYKLTDLPQ